ncbi:hypothetical protein AB0K00_47710 [Dactylosporangium sp. NPDC049525]|uniref:hypothetical protein n=1 Tax=Dactylosporangium sp. NPDC049525 TaxID=3154730 RepID=UPI003447438F
MTVRPAPAPFTWRRAPLSALLLVLMLLWLASPLFWLYAVGRVGPESDADPTPDQARAQRIVDWSTFCYLLIAPTVVLTIAWWTRRRVVLALTLAAIGFAVLALAALFLMD